MNCRAARVLALVIGVSVSLWAQPMCAQVPPCLDKKLPFPTFAEEIREANGLPPGFKIVVGDFRFKGLVHDADVVRARILMEIQEREFDGSNSEWLDEIAENIIRIDFQNRGYFEVQVDDLEVQPLDPTDPQHRVIIVAPIKEGEKFSTGDISIVSADPESVLAITEAELRQKFKIEKGVPLSIDKIRKGVEGAIRTYGDRGFIDATIIPAFSVDYKSHVVEVTMRVSEGRKYFVEKFEVLGVDGKTKTAIEARVKPGSVFDNALMEELFNQGKVASSRDVSYMNITNVTRNPEKATVDIVFDFRLCPR